MYDLGIIGGMGPEATSVLFNRIVSYTEVNCDQDHLNICILNKASIPDRTTYLIAGGESPLKYLNQCIDEMNILKVNSIVIPCNTSHFFVKDLNIPQQIKFINMIDETLYYSKERYLENNICVLGTLGTVRGRVYEKDTILNNIDKNIIYPSQEDQLMIMSLINNIKSGESKDIVLKELIYILSKIKNYNSSVVFVLGCTELSLLSNQIPENFSVIDPMDVLAVRAIKANGFKVKNNVVKTI